MKQIKIEIFRGKREPEFIEKLATTVWTTSVRTSHHFLTAQDIDSLMPQVKAAINGIEHLIVVWNGNIPIGFMGIQENKIEMLFLSPSYIGKGLGKDLINLAVNEYGVRYVDVNEQNKRAEGFYKHMGFYIFQRDEMDAQGNPFPILHMQRIGSEKDN